MSIDFPPVALAGANVAVAALLVSVFGLGLSGGASPGGSLLVIGAALLLAAGAIGPYRALSRGARG